MEINANALLAIGASPLMSFCPEEMEEIVGIASALVVNIGCLDMLEIEGMRIAAATAHRLGKPWVLDPVGAGASRIRTQTALSLIRDSKPTVIRGNASEIMCLAGEQIQSRGVDSSALSSDAVEGAKALALSSGAIVSVSGPVDYITDGVNVEKIGNGHPLMARVTAMGCTASAVTGAFIAAGEEPLLAARNAMALMGVAGERAAARSAGTGSLAMNFIDELSTFVPEDYAQDIRI
jgi:hydroxyethylthiazole kinase